MKRTRVIFLSVSLAVVLLFSGVLLANRSSQDVLFRALGNLAEVVHLVETEYVDELNQEAAIIWSSSNRRPRTGSGSRRGSARRQYSTSSRILRPRPRGCRPGKSSSRSKASTAVDAPCGRSGSS
jgi:hypothetical protein